MDPFSLSVGALTIIDTCLKSGKALIKLYEDHESAEMDVSGTLLKLKSIWHKTETQMAFLRKIWNSLDLEFRSNQVLLMSVLEDKLQEAINLLNSVIGKRSDPVGLLSLLAKKGAVRKTKYVFGVKDSLDKTLRELMEWRRLFDPSWYLLSRIANKELDQNLDSREEGPLKLLTGLRKSVRDLNSDATNLPVRPISSRDFVGARRAISSSTMSIAPIEGRIQDGIVDTMLVNPLMDAAGTTLSVMALSKALSRMDPSTFGLLRCCGVINKTDKYEFVFEVPHDLASPRSLRDLLMNSRPSLNLRVELAKQLAKSIFYLHTAGFVHKNIRPETILVFDHSGGKSLFLCGFENFRAAKDDTFRVGDDLPERNIYRHPLRQGKNPEKQYVMQHDIYSLGVLLLEFGLWRSFVKEGAVEFEPPEVTKDSRKRAFAIKRQILVTTKEELPQHAGERVREIVEKCLTCLDDETAWHQAEDKTTPEIEVGIKFIEEVLVQLHEIVI